ncbi:unnamed protein product [Diamesa serratosioi]
MLQQETFEELGSCELGTKEYWDVSYDKEINNYLAHGDTGEIWFEESQQFKIITWIMKCDDIQESDSLIDLGTGNGMMLIELAREGYKNLTGVDYSPKSIELSQKIAKDQDLEITYKVADLLSLESVDALGKFKIAHDKGTYDAVALMENPKEKRATYIKNVSSLMEDDGLFIITSCNFTEKELLESFTGTFTKYHIIPTQTFQFGGKIGNVVTSIVFKKTIV